MKKLFDRVKNNKGYTLTELVLVVFILAIFGVTIITLIQSGSKAYQTIINNKNAESDARLAISCIGVRVRRNDVGGAVRVEKCPLNNTDALVVSEVYDGVRYDSWYYFDEGALWELSFVPEDIPLNANNASIVARLKSFKVEYLPEQNAIREEVTYDRVHQGEIVEKTMSSLIALRAGSGGGTEGAVSP